jgi:hypothetical protein
VAMEVQRQEPTAYRESTTLRAPITSSWRPPKESGLEEAVFQVESIKKDLIIIHIAI